MFPNRGHIGSIDFSAGKYEGNSGHRKSQHLEGLRALKATGGHFAFNVEHYEVSLNPYASAVSEVVRINVVNIVPFFVMKTSALSRQKAKDSYDMYFYMDNYEYGIEEFIKLFLPFKDLKIKKDMVKVLKVNFQSINSVGPNNIVSFLDIDNVEDIEFI